MKKTYEELLEIDNIVGGLYKDNPVLKESKFGYAYTKFYKLNIEKVQKEFNEELQDIGINNALEDEKTKAIILDEKSATGYAHSKEQLKQYLKEYREVKERFLAKEIDVKPYISPLVPEMTNEQKDILTGLII